MNKHMKILVVDDFATMRRMVRNILTDLGYDNIHEADDGVSALPMLEQEGDYELVVADCKMHDMDGTELVENLRKDKRYKDLPVLFIAPNPSDEKLKKTLKKEKGHADCLVKPFTAEIMSQKIEDMLNEDSPKK